MMIRDLLADSRRWAASQAYWVGLIGLCVVYVGTARLGLMLDAVSGFATLFWPPTGIALASLLCYGARLWPSIALGAFIVNWSIGAPVFTACGTAVGNTLEAVIGAYLLRRVIRFDNKLERLHDVLGLVGFAAPIGTLISATIGVSSLWFGHTVAASAYAATWRAWWVGDMLGAILFAPLLLTWFSKPVARSPAGLSERGLLTFVVLTIGEFVFGPTGKLASFSGFSLLYLIFPPLIWAALRTGQRGAITSTFMIAVLATWHTVQGSGPFTRGTVSESLLLLQLFMAVVTVTVLMMAAMVAERVLAEQAARDSREALRRAHEALEMTVRQRTAALASTNDALRREIEHHQRIEEALKRTQEQLERTNELLVQEQQRLIDAMVKLERANKELQATQLQLIQAAKLESVGRLAAGVAHEVKNPLATLLIGIDHLSDCFSPTNERVAILLKDMRDAVRQADGVVRGLLDFSSPETLELTEEKLPTLIQQAFMLVKHEVERRQVAVVRHLADDLPRVRVDRHKVEQVFVNLFMNAVQAMPSGGTLTITASLTSVASSMEGVGIRQADRFRLGEPALIVEIEDTGSGIPEETLPKIFDPFFTTKPSGTGTGLGLTVTKKIIELHGGLIVAKNRPGGGVKMIAMFHTEKGAA